MRATCLSADDASVSQSAYNRLFTFQNSEMHSIDNFHGVLISGRCPIMLGYEPENGLIYAANFAVLDN